MNGYDHPIAHKVTPDLSFAYELADLGGCRVRVTEGNGSSCLWAFFDTVVDARQYVHRLWECQRECEQ